MQAQVHRSIEEIPKEKWKTILPSYFPFYCHEFLTALEQSHCVSKPTGWEPNYIACWEGSSLKGALLLFLKHHSYGEYIFDWDWASAYARHGLAYYPKLLSGIPFTPATTPKLLFCPDADKTQVTKKILEKVDELADLYKVSSTHHLFIDTNEFDFFKSHQYQIRKSFQYHWKNQGYENFNEFLSTLKSRKAKQIRKEREKASPPDIEIFEFTGSKLTAEHAKIFHQFYEANIDSKCAFAYLNLSFFLKVFETMSENILLYLAKQRGHWVAGSLSFYSKEKLYGRYWGSIQNLNCLHFELCYYRPIEFAIRNHIQVFEAGAQGEHKIQRGFLPVFTHSAHKIVSPVFRPAIEEYLAQESRSLEQIVSQLELTSPYRSQEIERK